MEYMGIITQAAIAILAIVIPIFYKSYLRECNENREHRQKMYDTLLDLNVRIVRVETVLELQGHPHHED